MFDSIRSRPSFVHLSRRSSREGGTKWVSKNVRFASKRTAFAAKDLVVGDHRPQ